MYSAAVMERGAVIATLLLLSCYQDVVLAAGGSGDSSVGPDPVTSSLTTEAATAVATGGSQTQTRTVSYPQSTPMSASALVSPATTSSGTSPTAMMSLTVLLSDTPTVTGPPTDSDDGGEPLVWVYVGTVVGAGFVCGILLLLCFTAYACKRTRRRGKGTEDEDGFVESQIQRKESLKSNLENKVCDVIHSNTTDTFGVTSPIVLSKGDSTGAMETNAFGSKDPVWSSTPPQVQETALLRAGFQQREGHRALKPARSLTTLHPPESAARKVKLHSPQPDRRRSAEMGANPPRKATSTSGLYQGEAQSTGGRRHYALQTATRDSTYDVPRDALQTQRQALSHYDVPKRALNAHKQSLPPQGSRPKHKPSQQNGQTHPPPHTSNSESYYDTPKQALATVPESKRGNPLTKLHSNGGRATEREREALYDVPRQATTLPQRHTGTGIYDTPKQLLKQGKPHSWKTGAPPPSSKFDAVPSKTNRHSSPRHSSSLYNIPASVGVDGYGDDDDDTEHVYDEPPRELIQRIVTSKQAAGKILHEGTSRQKLLPNGSAPWGRRSSSHYDLPSAEEALVPGGDGRDKILPNRPNHRGSSSHKFFHV